MCKSSVHSLRKLLQECSFNKSMSKVLYHHGFIHPTRYTFSLWIVVSAEVFDLAILLPHDVEDVDFEITTKEHKHSNRNNIQWQLSKHHTSNWASIFAFASNMSLTTPRWPLRLAQISAVHPPWGAYCKDNAVNPGKCSVWEHITTNIHTGCIF